MDMDQYDCLLGLNGFQPTKAGIYSAQKFLRFEAEIINLAEDDTAISHDHEAINLIGGVNTDELIPNNFEILPIDTQDIFHASAELGDNENELFKNLKNEVTSMFAYTYNDLGCCNILAHTINTNTESPIYIYHGIERVFVRI